MNITVGMFCLLLLLLFISTVHGQLGTTTCGFATQGICAATFPNSYCDIGAGLCLCPTPAGYVDDGTGTACTYSCGSLTAPTNGGVSASSGTYTGAVAVYSCITGYKIVGTSTRTCVQDSGWSGTAPTCTQGVLGDDCSVNINLCQLIQFGTCQDNTCKCLAGYEDDGTGNNCRDINECSANPCKNGATCMNLVNAYSCTCLPGYTDTNCSTNIDECASAPCQNGGTCYDAVNGYTCTCVAGYTGTHCITNINECASNPCQNGGTCNDLVNGYTCTCAAGFTDTLCATNINECASNPCINGGTCTDKVNDYSCTCVAGYTDKNCQTNINECIGNLCVNGATCVDEINNYTCLCVAGYDGRYCSNNINECATHSCQNGASCVDHINSYECVCAPGYNGTYCTINLDDCTPNPCVNGATCIDNVNDYTCNCVAGYTGKTCLTNINECASAPCLNGGTCVDSVNNYTCNCVAGYTDRNCQTNINECVGNTCQNGATCVDGINGYSCVCAQGYSGIFCQNDINECLNNSCQNGAYCVDKINGYNCDCLLGYDGTYCQNNINECVNHTCQNGATCVDGIDGYNCTCMAGYTGNRCQININECASHGCVNGATCVDGINMYTCTCAAGYTDTLCSTNINECASAPCKNGGTCVDGVNDYSCNCVAGYTDKNCQTNIDECVSAPCQNGGTCVDQVNDYTCNCVDGYTGKNCATNINECASDPCQNAGTCTDLVNRYNCTCVPGYNGDKCQFNINECLSHSCLNGATCVDGVNKYTCTCMAGYTDTFCQTNIDECATHNCQNGGTCMDGINNYTCICASGYTSFYCTTNINECASSPCLNGGTCTDNVNGYTCTCASGYTGLNCRPGVLGDDCSARAAVCANLAFAHCNGSTCVCNTGYEDPSSTGTCSKVDCGTITAPTNGVVNHTEGTKYQNKAYFYCNSGYTLTGLTSVTCRADKTWDGATPTCVIKDCGLISAPMNGNVTFTPNTLYQGKAEFACHVGYTLVGSSNRACLDTGVWGGTSPSCQIKNCGTLNAPSNGAVDQTDGTTYLSVTVFQCDSGYTLVGNSSLTCQADATWSSVRPTCNIKDCGVLSDLANGDIDLSRGTTYQANATFSCNTGYTLVGSSVRTCQASGVWSSVYPVCQINDCGALSDPSNGDVNLTAGTTYGKIVTYSCNAGFNLEGAVTRTCQATSVWSGVAPTCKRKDCGNLKAPTNGVVDLTAGTFFEATAVFTCNPGYTLTGFTTRDCTSAGYWDNASPTCIIKDCGPLSSPVHGQVLAVYGTTYNRTAVYSCNTGYQVNGVSTRLCQADGTWSASPPTCVIIDCGPVALISNGAVSYSNGTIYSSTVTYKCSQGFEVGGFDTRVCQPSGTWSGSQPVCTILSCDDAIVIPNGVAKTPSGSQVGDLAIYECLSGYGLVGNPNVSCGPSGFWGTVPECRLDCSYPPEIANGAAHYTGGALVGAKVTYTCSNGYYLSGRDTIECQSNGHWSNEPFCFIIFAKYSERCYVTAQCVTADASCRDDGNGTDRCLCHPTDQNYDATIDYCLADCGGLPAPTYGEIALPDMNSAGQIAVYSCHRGYSLTGPATRTCMSTGQWNGTAPQCTTGCPYPVSPENGQVDASRGTASGDTITYTCDQGYTLIGAVERKCNSDATWSDNMPECLKECPVLPDIENGWVDLALGRFEGSKAVYVCQNNYAVVGESTRTCQSTGEWDGVQPECVFAIFPDVILVFGSLFVFLVLVDIFVLAFCIYVKYFQKPDIPGDVDFDELKEKDEMKEKDRKKDQSKKKAETPDVFEEKEETGVPPEAFHHLSKEYRDRKEREKREKHERKKQAEVRVASETRRQILRDEQHPPPKKGPNVRVERNPYLGLDKPKLLKNLMKSRNKVSKRDIDFGMDGLDTERSKLDDISKIDDLQFSGLDTSNPPPNSVQQQAMKELREETTHTINDGGYGTANSDELNARIPDEDQLSLDDLTPQETFQEPPTQTPKEHKKPVDEFSDTFRGRLDLPPVSDTQVNIDREMEKPYTDKERRHLKNSVNTYATYSPTQKPKI